MVKENKKSKHWQNDIDHGSYKKDFLLFFVAKLQGLYYQPRTLIIFDVSSNLMMNSDEVKKNHLERGYIGVTMEDKSHDLTFPIFSGSPKQSRKSS